MYTPSSCDFLPSFLEDDSKHGQGTRREKLFFGLLETQFQLLRLQGGIIGLIPLALTILSPYCRY